MSNEFEIKNRYYIGDLLEIIKVLRAPGGCPWDAEQTHTSIKKNFIEETYEVVEAINKNNSDMLREELGDVLLQIVMHTEMEREQGGFCFEDVVDEVVKKLVARHPHVFGDVVAENSSQALESWNEAKSRLKGEKNKTQSMQSVPRELPALMRAQKVQHKASKAGFDWQSADGAFDKLYEEINELKIAMNQGYSSLIEDEFGDVLFSCVNIARFINVDSEEALTKSTDKFISRFSSVEQMAREKGIDMKSSSLQVLDELWDNAKKIKNAEKSAMED